MMSQFQSIDPVVDQAFREFFLSYENDPQRDISRVSSVLLPPLETVALSYLFEHPSLEIARRYHKNLRLVWVDYYRNGRLRDAETFLSRVLLPIYQREQRSGTQVPKGPIYYFWAGTCLLMRELDKGFLLMHSSYSEDVRTNSPQPTPARKFVTLQFDDARQFFGPLVIMYADYLNEFLIPYRLLRPSSLTKKDFRTRFLESASPPDIIFTFTHALARLHQYNSISQYILRSDFAGQYGLNLLFDLVLVIDNAIKQRHPDSNSRHIQASELLGYLASNEGYPLKHGHLTGVVSPDVKSKGFDIVLLDLLDRVYMLPSPPKSLSLESDIAITYLIRNRGAHELSTSRVVATRLNHIAQSIFNVLFLTVDSFY